MATATCNFTVQCKNLKKHFFKTHLSLFFQQSNEALPTPPATPSVDGKPIKEEVSPVASNVKTEVDSPEREVTQQKVEDNPESLEDELGEEKPKGLLRPYRKAARKLERDQDDDDDEDSTSPPAKKQKVTGSLLSNFVLTFTNLLFLSMK
jgi:hypothetical protein